MEISKINQHVIKYSMILLLFISMVLSGCLNNNLNTEVDPTNVKTTETAVTETKLFQSPTLTLTPTRQEPTNPIITNTVRETSTQTSTIIATWVPPTLNDYSIQTLIDTNGNCELPCWWGLVPGVTTKEQVVSFFDQIDIDSMESLGKNILPDEPSIISEFIEISYALPGGNGVGSLEVIFHNDILSYIRVKNTASYRYQLESTLNKLGKPDEILLYVISRGPGRDKPSALVLIYKNKRTTVAYGSDGFEVEENIQVCINNYEKPALITWDDEFRFLERIDQIFMGGDGERKLQKLENATSLTINGFYEQFTDPDGSDCFETSMEFWKDFP